MVHQEQTAVPESMTPRQALSEVVSKQSCERGKLGEECLLLLSERGKSERPVEIVKMYGQDEPSWESAVNLVSGYSPMSRKWSLAAYKRQKGYCGGQLRTHRGIRKYMLQLFVQDFKFPHTVVAFGL